ncbi:MAG: aminotransferase class I/II-fold pyridoxal phosphate-dependent enzyme [Lachnospiraceae bacterium]|nr:aminotransferase class I/II-fold pyridoxal phosphate-dependent enzyme [Lachnospiraceae bacterium]
MQEIINKTLHEKLIELGNSDEYAFHMPGHKRNETQDSFMNIMKMDITEIKGFDNLHCPENIIKNEQEFAAQLYGAEKTFFLINGSTCGILAAICGTTNDNDTIIFARNSHKSAYHAMYLKGLRATYVYPQQTNVKSYILGAISAADIEVAMEKSNAKVVFITSPTYEGVVSNIEKIAAVVHKRDGILIVDEAHGSHLGFHPDFPASAVKQGADIVIQSMHKTLPSLTQTALLHICSNKAMQSRVKEYLQIFQTSSPSYVLMASMTRCLHMLHGHGKDYFNKYQEHLQNFYKKATELQKLFVLHKDYVSEQFHADWDASKIVICADGLTDRKGVPYRGKELAKDLLEKYRLQMEMISENYVLAMTSIYDTEEGFDRLLHALKEIDKTLCHKNELAKAYINYAEKTAGNAELSIKVAIEGKQKKILWKDGIGEISAEYIYLYPPGSPILVPGEKITEEVWKKIEKYKEIGLNIQGPSDPLLNEIYIAITS